MKGISEFSLVEDGDVLVIPYSDVGWTPIFAKAGATVAESGGGAFAQFNYCQSKSQQWYR